MSSYKSLNQILKEIDLSYIKKDEKDLLLRKIFPFILNFCSIDDINFKYIFEKILQKKVDNLCIIPCGYYTDLLLPFLKNKFKKIILVDNFKKGNLYGIPIIDESQLDNLLSYEKIDAFFISCITPSLIEYFSNKYYPSLTSEEIVKFFLKKDLLIKIDDLIDYLFFKESEYKKFLTPLAFELLKYEFNNTSNLNLSEKININKPTIVFISSFFFDIYEKIEILKKYINANYIWIRENKSEYYKQNDDILNCSLLELLIIIKQLSLKNVLFIIVLPISNYNLAAFIKDRFPEVKVINYIYDFLNIFCPYEYKELYKQTTNYPSILVESEYFFLEKFLKGEIIDGLLYKDGGEDFYLLKMCKIPKLFFPTVKSKKIYLTSKFNKLDKIIFLGTLYSPTYHNELFSDVFLFDVFEKVLKQNFKIDVYYVKLEYIINEYKNYFKNYSNIRFIKGKPLDILFQEIDLDYGFGWMIYDDDFKIVKKHTEIILPSKIFAYLALGVPIIVTSDLYKSAEFIEKYKIGIVINRKEINKLKEIIMKIDYNKLKQNVYNVREEFCLENYEKKFIEFIKKFI